MEPDHRPARMFGTIPEPSPNTNPMALSVCPNQFQTNPGVVFNNLRGEGKEKRAKKSLVVSFRVGFSS